TTTTGFVHDVDDSAWREKRHRAESHSDAHYDAVSDVTGRRDPKPGALLHLPGQQIVPRSVEVDAPFQGHRSVETSIPGRKNVESRHPDIGVGQLGCLENGDASSAH